MKAVIYARYSSDNQREESIEGQLRECKEYAEKNGITILRSYIDRALSAKTDNRPEFQKMVQDSAKGLFDTVLVWKLDRFARNRYDSAHYKAVLRRNGVKVVSATENISDGPEGIILESMLEGMAEYYSAELAQKINRGLTENALKGKSNGGSIPLGYVLGEDRHLKIDPATAPIVREIYQRYASGEMVRSIIKSLNERHILTKQGKPFCQSSFNVLLRNRKYIGEYHYRDIVIPDAVPAIIPKDLFERVQARMEKNRHAPARTKAPEEYLLTTKLFCGHCGRLMVGESGTGKSGTIHRYYKCIGAKRRLGCHKKAVKKDWIERVAVQYTIQRVFQDELIAQIADKLVELQNTEDHTLPLLRKQLADTNRGIENMLNAIQLGVLTSSTKERLEELEKLREELKVSILQAELERPKYSREDIMEWISRFTQPHTDLWQRTYYHFRNDNAPVLQMDIEEKFFSFVVKTDFPESHHRFDQCGVVLYLDAENWLKGSIEYENERFQHLGSVVTNHGYSDWATTEIPASIKSMWYRLSRRENDFCIECSEDGITFCQMRVCHLHEAKGKIRFGVYACSPEDSSFRAVFTNMELTECKWLAHDGQAPDKGC